MSCMNCGALIGKMEEMEAENAKLRAALQEIADGPPPYQLKGFRHLAREALKACAERSKDE